MAENTNRTYHELVNAVGCADVVLSESYNVNGIEYKSLHIDVTKMNGLCFESIKDSLAAAGTPSRSTLNDDRFHRHVVAMATGIPADVIGRFHAADYYSCIEIARNFFAIINLDLEEERERELDKRVSAIEAFRKNRNDVSYEEVIDMVGSADITLSSPIDYEGKTYTEFHVDLKNITGESLERIRDSVYASGHDIKNKYSDDRFHRYVFAHAAGVFPELIGMLPAVDYIACTDCVKRFFGITA